MGSSKEYGDLVHRDVHAPPTILTYDQESSIPKAVTLMAHAKGTQHTSSLFPHFYSTVHVSWNCQISSKFFPYCLFYIYITAHSSSLNPLIPNQPSIIQHITILTLITEFFSLDPSCSK